MNSQLDITILGDIKDFLGIHVYKENNRCLYISQPQLIDQVIEQSFQSNAKLRTTLAKSSSI